MFIRVDVLPNKLYRYTGDNWIEIPKSNTTLYLDNEYMKYVAQEIDARRMDIDDLTPEEQDEFHRFKTNSSNRA